MPCQSWKPRGTSGSSGHLLYVAYLMACMCLLQRLIIFAAKSGFKLPTPMPPWYAFYNRFSVCIEVDLIHRATSTAQGRGNTTFTIDQWHCLCRTHWPLEGCSLKLYRDDALPNHPEE